MGYDDYRIFKIDQKLLQPCDRIQIQMVRRLVEQQNIRISKQCLCQQHLDLQGTRQILHQCIVILGRDTESVQQCRCVTFRIPAVHLGKFCLQLTGTDSIFIGKIFFHINRIFFFSDIIQSLVSHDNSIQNRIFVIFKMILLQERKTLARGNDHITARRLQLTGQDLQKCGFSGTVGTDQSVTVSFGKFDIDIFKKCLFSKA